eukprot:Plantae.Rhodophyta-Purpureofilum_apyrenoidigerum.ctg11185.p1 GENE.Plantae.Rhodophyta-Purpureofilum_apyrenoidigerum.ctg11185~~Plantae.Rhodophyta-Purpureofilum_apyrenoidigerum.ctg11185.p1  ORF type:complete len:313 (-),score=29.06 Plantae.Rhodophyta-Purpureofilum_apyrenoidigerum.ctg11185:81-974(-)
MGDERTVAVEATRLFASASAGLFSRCFVHPMDTVRTRIMASTSGAPPTIRSAIATIIRRDGFRGLYRGFGITASMQAPGVATFLTTYDVSKAKLVQWTGFSPMSPLVHLVSGLAAETVSAVFWVPMEVLKQRAQLRDASASSIVALRDLVKHEGFAALFRGYMLTIGVFGPYSMIYFASYEQWKHMLCRKLNVTTSRDLPTPAILASAAASGGIAAAATTPLDVVKTRIQTQGDVALKNVQRYLSTREALRRIFLEEGFRGLCQGMSARVFWIMPQTAITMSTFEKLKNLFHIPEIE